MLNTDKLCPGCMNDNGGEQTCSFCGYNDAQKNDADKLSVRFWLAERYMVGKVLAVSSEGVVYLAWDNIENTPVTVKEYFPAGIAHRNEDLSVSMDVNYKFAYNEGLMAFMELNKKLMSLELPSLIPVLDVFEENGTAYVVNASVAGITLASFLERNGGVLKWEQIRPLLLPLIDTVKGLHDERIIHGGISPETILVSRDGKLKLTGISILNTRCAGGEIPAQVYSGYAAAEQYGIENLTIGAYTDVYGLSATLFRVIIGTVPPNADARLTNDSMEISARFADELPRQVLVAMANGLQVRPEMRTTTIEAFKNELVYGETQENARKAAAMKKAQEAAAAKKAQELAMAREEARKAEEARNVASTSKPKPVPKKEPVAPPPAKEKSASGAKYAVISALCTAFVFILLLTAVVFLVPSVNQAIFGAEETKDNSTSEPVLNEEEESSGGNNNTQLHTVPDFTGMTYAEILDEEEYERFDFVIVDKKFTDDIKDRGRVCEQSVKEGTDVEKNTTIELVISLGPESVNITDVSSKKMSEDEAILELLKQGFAYENIKVLHMSDSDKEPNAIIKQEPKAGTKISLDSEIKITLNDYKGEKEDDK